MWRPKVSQQIGRGIRFIVKLAERSLFLLMTAFIFSCVQADRAQVTTRSVPVAATTEGARLQFVVILTRHGVRSPISPPDQINIYSAEPWPSWGVKPGELTAHGAKLIHQMGSYDRAYLVAAGLLQPSGCADATHIRIRADVDSALAKQLALGPKQLCRVVV